MHNVIRTAIVTLNREDVVGTLLREYPAIADDLQDETWAGLLHLEIACFARHTQKQIDSGNKSELVRCYSTARHFLMNGDPEVTNALYVSYLEHIDFHDGKNMRSWAKALLPEPLATGYREIWGAEP